MIMYTLDEDERMETILTQKIFSEKPPCETVLSKQVIAVTNRRLCSRPFMEQIERICRFQPHAVILREKDLTEEEYARLAEDVLAVCRSYHVPCILHTYPNTAKALGCTAIHLPLPLLRTYRAGSDSVLDKFSVIGTSVHSVDEAREAGYLKASYLTAGHIYKTDCKKGIPPRGTEFLREVCNHTPLPVYAIGGIKLNESQFTEILNCGARGGCIMSGMMTL